MEKSKIKQVGRVILIFAFCILNCTACAKSPQKNILAKINNYEITKEEFEEEFKASHFGRTDTLESRKEFLNNLLNQKLILQDAQAKGLDKDKNFLKLVEKFWEQALLKLALEKKTSEIAGSCFVSDAAVKNAYDKLLKEGKTDKPYEAMFQQIKWEITKIKESEKINDWIAALRKNSEISINNELLDKK